MKPLNKILTLTIAILMMTIASKSQNGTWAPFMNLSGWNTVSTDSVNNQLDITDGSDTIMTFDGTNYGSYTYPYRALGQTVKFIRTSGTEWFFDQGNLYQGSNSTAFLTGILTIAQYGNNVFVFGSKINGSYPVVEYNGTDGSIKKQYTANGIPTGVNYMGIGVYNGIPYISVCKYGANVYSTYKWNGSSWVFAFNSHAISFAEYNGNLYYQSGSDSISCYNGTSVLNTWTFTGVGPITALTVFNGSLYVTGVFTSIDGVTCQNSAIYTETKLNTGISSIENNSIFNVFPNPFADIINVTLDKKSTVTVFDMSGRVVNVQTFEEGTHSVNMSDIKPGNYILRTSGGDVRKISRE